jgi:hypothetical protein
MNAHHNARQWPGSPVDALLIAPIVYAAMQKKLGLRKKTLILC